MSEETQERIKVGLGTNLAGHLGVVLEVTNGNEVVKLNLAPEEVFSAAGQLTAMATIAIQIVMQAQMREQAMVSQMMDKPPGGIILP